MAALERPPAYLYASRARYFLKFYGRSGYWCANLLWTLGATIAELRTLLQRRKRVRAEKEARDIWTAAFGRMPDARRGMRGAS